MQVVAATLNEGVNTSIIGCEFIEDSNAAGCQIVLTTNNGEQDYYNLIKNQNTNLTAIAVTLELPPSCYSGVKAFDIEFDGSIGTLAIPGHITNLSQVQCTPATLPGSCVRNAEEFALVIFHFSSQTQFIRNSLGSLDNSISCGDFSGGCLNIICCDYCDCWCLQI